MIFLSGKVALPIGMFIVPYKSIGNKNGHLIGFKPDYIIFEGNERKVLKDIVVGICDDKLSENNLYSGIFGLEIEGIV